MDFLNKVREVKENIRWWQEEWGDEFSYLFQEFATEDEETGTTSVYITKGEHEKILTYLASIGFLKIISKKTNKVNLKILPKRNHL